MAKYSEEVVFQIWNDQTGERIEAGLDLDVGTLVNVRSKDNDGKTCQEVILTVEQGEWLMSVLPSVIGNAKKRINEPR